VENIFAVLLEYNNHRTGVPVEGGRCPLPQCVSASAPTV
jgi:hypothetical protein